METVLDRWLAGPSRRSFTTHEVLLARQARTSPLPSWLRPELLAALAGRGIATLYSHQREAVEAARAGSDCVIATPTASGKTLCYNLPVFQALCEDPRARALYLFPTKALARDQVSEARALAAALPEPPGIAVYDGDTPAEQRRAARRRARILATNPEMLHTGILPHHPSWAELLSGLRYVVIDELHTYRGVFGAGVANVIRRLRRLCRFHGSDPVFISTSATIANPEELAGRLVGRPARLVAESGAPSGERHLLIYNPPLVDPAIGLRGSYLKAACRLTRDLATAGVGTLVFCRSRLATEVLLRHLRDLLARAAPEEDPELLAERVRGYRGGYLPDRRREVERSLREGEAKVVVSTSALELGIDIGSLDAVVVAGWPGSRASLWQRAGRAGRRLAPSLVVLVTSSEPVDQYVAADPDYLLGQAPEHARIDPDNVSILVPHLTCAAFELPFARGEGYASHSGEETEEILGCLCEAGRLHRSSEGSTHYVGQAFPAGEVALRGPLAENYLVIERPAGEVIAEVDHDDAPETLFEGALYQLEGRQLQVERLDHDQRKAYVRAVEVDYYTEAMTYTRVRVLEESAHAEVARAGEVHVLHRVVGFKKIKLHTGENLGYGEIALPDREMHTTACWLQVPPGSGEGIDPSLLAEAALGLGQALHSSAALLLMSDPRDLGRAVGDARSSWFAVAGTRTLRDRYSVPDDGSAEDGPLAPVIFLFDRYPGGTGLAERLFDLRAELLERARRGVLRCRCERGCPSCIGPGGSPGVKALVLRMIDALAGAAPPRPDPRRSGRDQEPAAPPRPDPRRSGRDQEPAAREREVA
jgi:DEAD/DEAH box helicase domain-containing protein